MDKIKKNMKRIWNSKCKYLVMIACALILVNGVNLLQTSLKFLNNNGEEVKEIKSVEIESEDNGPGSFHIMKSASWTGHKEATIQFDVSTNKKIIIENKEEIIEGVPSGADVILVLDTSGSMKTKDRLVHLKEGSKELVNEILSEGNHKIALITFDSHATLKSSFTSDKSSLISQISGLRTGGGTNYANAYKEVISLLSNYKSSFNRDLVMLFLTDGAGGSAKSQYQILKDTYDITIVGIQYDMGTSIKSTIKNISDEQYLADTSNIQSILEQSLGEATDKIQGTEIKRAINYETFEIEDYVTKEFFISSVDDIKVSRGTVGLETLEDGTQKVIWKISGNGEFATGTSATMSIKTHYQGELNADRVYPTNQRESIKTKLQEGVEKIITSELTPQLRAGYYVTYDPNLPSECNPSSADLTVKRNYFPYEKVDKKLENYTCIGWQLKEWAIESGIPSLGDDRFEMPDRDITVKAIWTKIDLNKNMDGTIYEPIQELIMAIKENEGKSIGIDTSLNFYKASSETNGRGLYIRSGTQNDTHPIYYYRGAVENNNVLFAGICWQIVRTTETGGVKLIYNGISSDAKTCVTMDDAYIDKSVFNRGDEYSPLYTGYMSSISSIKDENKMIWLESAESKYFGNSVTYSDGKYKLVSTQVGLDSNHRYTCGSQSESATCSTIYYAIGASGMGNELAFVLPLSGGMVAETMFENLYDSEVKIKIDSWYENNIEKRGYTKYLEDAVWCNNRTIQLGAYSTLGNMNYHNSEASVIRKLNSESANPAVKDAFACSNVRDRFTVNASIGNKVLTYPVGMITADEVELAGMGYGKSNASNDSYLYKDFEYWTMTYEGINDYNGGRPDGSSVTYVTGRLKNFSVKDGGYILGTKLNMDLSMESGWYSTSLAIRPMISLKPGILVSVDGNGTKEQPYEVVME